MKRCSYCGHDNEDGALECAKCHQREFEPAGSDPGAENDLVVVKIFSTVEIAEVAATRLRANGLECDIQVDDAGGMLPPTLSRQGVRLLVLSTDFVEAKALLASNDPA